MMNEKVYKLMISFAGTDGTAKEYSVMREKIEFKENVIRVYIEGCQHKETGNGALFPNFKQMARKIYHAFSLVSSTSENVNLPLQGVNFNLNELAQKMGDAIIVRGVDGIESEEKNDLRVTSICLEGFSRGAVAAMAVCKKINKLGIPLHLIANQPVPGQLTQHGINSLYQKYADLTDCHHLSTVSVYLSNSDKKNSFLENNFYKQMIPKFSPEKGKVISVPYQSHMDWLKHSILSLQIHKELIELGYAIEQPTIDQSISQQYFKSKLFFIPSTFEQKLFGDKKQIQKDPAYYLAHREVIEAGLSFQLKNLPLKGLSDESVMALHFLDSFNVMADSDADNGFEKYREWVLGENSKRAIEWINFLNLEMSTYFYVLNTINPKMTAEKWKKYLLDFTQTVVDDCFNLLNSTQSASVMLPRLNERKNEFLLKLQHAQVKKSDQKKAALALSQLLKPLKKMALQNQRLTKSFSESQLFKSKPNTNDLKEIKKSASFQRSSI